MRLYVDSPDDFDLLDWLLHDTVFRADGFSCSEEALAVSFERPRASPWGFARIKAGSSSIARSVLTICGVSAVRIRAEAKIEQYDVASIQWRDDEGAIRISANAPFEATIIVSEIDVRLETASGP